MLWYTAFFSERNHTSYFIWWGHLKVILRSEGQVCSHFFIPLLHSLSSGLIFLAIPFFPTSFSPLASLPVLDNSNQVLAPLLSDWAGVGHFVALLLLATTVSEWPWCSALERGSFASPAGCRGPAAVQQQRYWALQAARRLGENSKEWDHPRPTVW